MEDADVMLLLEELELTEFAQLFIDEEIDMPS